MLRGNEQRTQQNPTEPTHGIHRAPWLGPNEREIFSRDSTNVSPPLPDPPPPEILAYF